MVQHDAIMATLALLQPAAAAAAADSLRNAASPLPRLPSVYPQILAVVDRDGDVWTRDGDDWDWQHSSPIAADIRYSAGNLAAEFGPLRAAWVQR